ncbi:MAG: DUF1287 domain-containing protein [Polyangia bacterium]|nr:DUF1287 domain-containing protein [Polyangia bacterium]
MDRFSNRPAAALWVLAWVLGGLWGWAGCGESRAMEAPRPAEASQTGAPRAAAGPRAHGMEAAPSAPEGRGARSAPVGRLAEREASAGSRAGLPTGLKDRGIFSHLDSRVRWSAPSWITPRDTQVIVDKKRRILTLVADGAPVKAYPISLGFSPTGHKARQGDGRTPEGSYRIVEMLHRALPARYGARSMLLSYPSVKDGRAGLASGLISRQTLRDIEAAEGRGAIPPQRSALGGSLRIHGGGVGRDWTHGCIALRDPDAVELYRFLRVGSPVVIHGGGPRPPWPDRDADGIPDGPDALLGAHKAALNGARYHESYLRLPFPGGDVPAGIGVCTDVVVRALRNAGIDLQVELNRHIKARPRLYPWIDRPDPNIDHRRVRNLLVWFKAHARSVGASAGNERRRALLPGDIVFLDTLPRPGPDHLGIVSDTLGPGGWPLIVNNWTVGFRTQAMDLLPGVPITHHFRLR